MARSHSRSSDPQACRDNRSGPRVARSPILLTPSAMRHRKRFDLSAEIDWTFTAAAIHGEQLLRKFVQAIVRFSGSGGLGELQFGGGFAASIAAEIYRPHLSSLRSSLLTRTLRKPSTSSWLFDDGMIASSRYLTILSAPVIGRRNHRFVEPGALHVGPMPRWLLRRDGFGGLGAKSRRPSE